MYRLLTVQFLKKLNCQKPIWDKPRFQFSYIFINLYGGSAAVLCIHSLYNCSALDPPTPSRETPAPALNCHNDVTLPPSRETNDVTLPPSRETNDVTLPPSLDVTFPPSRETAAPALNCDNDVTGRVGGDSQRLTGIVSRAEVHPERAPYQTDV